MTVFDLSCDACGRLLGGPDDGTRFLYHPGDFLLKDDSGLLCSACWQEAEAWLGGRTKGRCSVCGAEVERPRSLHVHVAGDPAAWQLCREHAAAFLNRLRTVEPKLDAAGLTFAGDWAR
jgi:hypothetical protein